MIVSTFIPPVLLVRWQNQCEPVDVDRIRLATEAAFTRMGGPVVYVAVIPEDVPPPNAQTRTALRAGTDHGRSRCLSMHLVIEGEGLRLALLRSLTAGMMLATRGSFSIHTHLIDALSAARGKISFDVEDIFKQGKEAGITVA